MPVAGFATSLYTSGTSTPLTDEPMSQLAGKTYRVTDAAKRVLDPTTEVTVEDDETPVAASDIVGIDHLAGTVTFASDYTVTGPVTLSGSYVPRLRFAEAHAFDYTYSRTKLISTVFTPGASSASEKSFAGMEMLAGSVQSLDPNRADLDSHETNERILSEVIRDDEVILFEHEATGLRAWVRLYGINAGASADARLEAGFNFESVVRKSANPGFDSSITFV
jgi:hypothetical protein